MEKSHWKLTVLEALDIFFGNRSLNLGDKSISASENENILIRVDFKEFPESIIIDETVPTLLVDGFLLNRMGFSKFTKSINLDRE